jgi:uncharacterized protein with NAD-binding domain and iron-sulfur cluster
VTVYERRAWGGKARSTWVPNSATGGRKPLPGEHGFRFEFGFYYNLPDTLRRIPFGSNRNGVFDNLVDAADFVLARDGSVPDLTVPFEPNKPATLGPSQIVETLMALLGQQDLPADGTAYLVNRLVVFLSSCDRRRREQWENTPWTKFIGVDRFAPGYGKIAGQLPRYAQASNAPRTSTDWVGQALEGALYCLTGETDGQFLRLMNGPTNERWIEPWLGHLKRLGVQLRLGEAVERLDVHHGNITAAHTRSQCGVRTVHADWYICALPVERARRLMDNRILAADPTLAHMRELQTGWMNGIKFFLRDNQPIADGVMVYIDGPWAVTSVNQAQYWQADFAQTYGDGRAHDSLSAIVANWGAPGVIYGKPARECTPNQVVREVWEQIKRAVNKPGQPPKLTDDLVLSWNIDPGMTLHHGHLVSADPLTVPTVSQRLLRPDSRTAIPNLILAGDYLRLDAIVGTMEAASEGGRLAANTVLAKAGSHEMPTTVFPHFRPHEWEPLKQVDEERYRRGESNLFDTDMTLDQLKSLLGETGKLVGVPAG